MKLLKVRIRLVVYCGTLLLLAGIAKGEPNKLCKVTLNGKVPYRYSLQRLKNLEFEGSRVLLKVSGFEGYLLLDERDEYHFSTNHVSGRIFLETGGVHELVGIGFQEQEGLHDLRREDLRSLRGVFIDGEPSRWVLQLLDYIDPDNVFVTVEISMFLNEHGEFPSIDPKIKFLSINSDLYVNKVGYLHLKKMHALEFLFMTSGIEKLDLELLGNCTNLTWLDVSRCEEVENIEFVQNLPELRSLDLYMTPVRDLTPIQDLKHIESVNATGSLVARIPKKPIQSLVELNIVATHVDSTQVEAFAKSNPQCTISHGWNQMLQMVLKGVDQVKMVSGAIWVSRLEDGTEVEEKDHLLFETNNLDDLKSLIECIEVDPEKSNSYCFCGGDPIFWFYKDGELVAVLSHHHGKTVRWNGGKWPWDGALTDESRIQLLDWLEEHGMPEPKKEYEEDLRQEKENQETVGKLVAATPTSLTRFFTGEHAAGITKGYKEIQEMNKALLEQYPKKRDRILALLGWFGSGDDSWDSFFSYDMAAKEMLQIYSSDDVIKIVMYSTLSPSQIEGAARYWKKERITFKPGKIKARLREYHEEQREKYRREQQERESPDQE